MFGICLFMVSANFFKTIKISLKDPLRVIEFSMVITQSLHIASWQWNIPYGEAVSRQLNFKLRITVVGLHQTGTGITQRKRWFSTHAPFVFNIQKNITAAKNTSVMVESSEVPVGLQFRDAFLVAIRKK
jgi:hypothetical protein